jgi:heme oxygenase
MPDQLHAYVDRINTIADSTDPSGLLAHSYVRYLGDLSEGQSVQKVIAKAYDLDEASGLGMELYELKELGGSRKANQGDMKKIEEWFRKGMNTGGGRDEVVKGQFLNLNS